jgi:hypothetical protein
MAKLLLLLECLLCRDRFTSDAVQKREYYLETQVCHKCYLKLQKTSSGISCFGKLPKGRSPGYSTGNPACTALCADRKVCASFIKRIKEK